MEFGNKIIVRKRRMEKEFNNLKLIYCCYDVIKTSKEQESGMDILDIYRVIHVIDSWDFTDLDEIF